MIVADTAWLLIPLMFYDSMVFMKLKNKRVLVTGGGSGLGLSLSKKLVYAGATVHICGRSSERLEYAKSFVKDSGLVTHQCDITDYKAVESMVWDIGLIDILINNAGIWLGGGLEETSAEQVNRVITTNLTGALYTSKAVLPSMRQVEAGIIMNIVSTSSLHARGDKVVYAASKWGMRGFTESLRSELTKTNIRVFGVYPGKMKTELFSNAGDEVLCDDWLEPEVVAEFILSILGQHNDIVVDQLVVTKKHC